MNHFRNRVTAGILGIVLTFTLIACNGDDDPTDTTAPGNSETTSPVGS